ncbi:MAG: hypothetical protein MJ102_08885 [Clostridia bacterium]|nr:hypothetical protein [Clostridia bacterium]
MAKGQLADLPEKGIVMVMTGDKTYVYFTVKAYRNAKGKPTSKRISIGKYYEEYGELIEKKSISHMMSHHFLHTAKAEVNLNFLNGSRTFK